LISTSNADIDFIGLETITDPLKSDGHVIKIRAREQGVGTNAPFLLVELNQGGGSPLAILNITQGTLTTTFTEYQYVLTASEADSITDYADLEIRLEASCASGTCSAGSARDAVEVSWLEFSVLDAPPIQPPTLDSITLISTTAVQLDWTPPVDQSQILSFDIERNQTAGFSVVGNVLNGTNSFLDQGLTENVELTYRVISVGSTNSSLPSNEISVTTFQILEPSSVSQPDSDPSVRWVNGIGFPPCTDLETHNCVSEIIRDDFDFIRTTGLGTSNTDTQFYTLSDIPDPLQSDGHVIRYTLSEANVGTNPVGFSIELRQGVTQIAKFVHDQGTIPSSFTLFERTLNTTQADAITDYNDLELTLIGSCDVGCTNGEREKILVSWIQFGVFEERIPLMLEITTVDSTQLSQTWEAPLFNGSSAINGYQLERENCGKQACLNNFQVIGFFTDLNTIDSTLNQTELYQYRVRSNNTEGLSEPSIAKLGQTSGIDITQVTTTGVTLEPSQTHSFTKNEVDTFISVIELFNPDPKNLDEMIKDWRAGKLPMFSTILQLNNGTYNYDPALVNGTILYGDEYVSRNNLNDWFATILNTARTQLGLGQ